MDTLCYICKINNATENLEYCSPEARLCKRCLNFIGKNFNDLFSAQLDPYEFNPLTILRNVPYNRKSYTLKKILKILSLPEYFVFQEIKNNIRKINLTCSKCSINSKPLEDYFRIIEEKNNFSVMCRHNARKLTSHTLCNFCGVRYMNNDVIVQNGKQIKHKFKCFLCIEKKKIIDKIT